MKPVYILLIFIVGLMFYYYRKDNFYNIQEEKRAEKDLYYRPHTFTNQVVPATENTSITKNDLDRLFKSLRIYSNGAPKGANVNVTQNLYDLIFKDILVCSDKRNEQKYPNPNNYSVTLNINIDKIYKAELIDVYVPAATDDAINIPINANRLYFSYNTLVGYVIIQPGTYSSPAGVAMELTRQFKILFTNAGAPSDNTVGVHVIYDKNLNRYIFKDFNATGAGTLVIYSTNGYVVTSVIVVENSITDLMMLNYEGPVLFSPYVSGPKFINSTENGVLFVDVAEPGDFGFYNGVNVPLDKDCVFSNCIISDVVLTNCKIYLSLGKLDGDTCNVILDQTSTHKIGNTPPVFCQVPNNTCVSSNSVKTLLGQPHNFSAIQFYNPPISKLNRLDVKWYMETGNLLRILDHCFTIRIHYFQKRIDTTDFSYPIP